MVLSLRDRHTPQLRDVGGYLPGGSLEERLAFRGGRLAGISLDSRLRERRPPRHYFERSVRPVHPGVLRLSVAVFVDGAGHIHGFGIEEQVEGGLQLAGVGHAATIRVADPFYHRRAPFRYQVEAGGDQGCRLLHHRQAGRGLDEVLVRAVAVHQQDPLKAVADQGQCHIRAVAAESVPLDRDRTRKIHVVRRVTVHYRRQEHRLGGQTLRGAPAHRLDQRHVRVDGQMVTVILQRPYGHDRNAPFTGRLRYLGPAQLPELQRLSPQRMPPFAASPLRFVGVGEAVHEGYRLAHVRPQACDGRVLVGGVRAARVPY